MPVHHGRSFLEARAKVDREREYSPAEAVQLIKEAIGLEKGSAEPNRTKVGTITQDQVRQIAEKKLGDLNAHDVDQAAKVIAGTARSMGVEVVA